MELGAEDVAAKHPTYSNIISIMIPLVIRFKRHRHRIGALQYVSFYNGLLFLPICLLNQSAEYADLLWPFFCKHEDLPPRENVQIRQIDG